MADLQILPINSILIEIQALNRIKTVYDLRSNTNWLIIVSLMIIKTHSFRIYTTESFRISALITVWRAHSFQNRNHRMRCCLRCFCSKTLNTIRFWIYFRLCNCYTQTKLLFSNKQHGWISSPSSILRTFAALTQNSFKRT